MQEEMTLDEYWGGLNRTNTTKTLTASEASVQTAIIKLLLLDNWLVLRINSGVMEKEDRRVAFCRWWAPGHDGENAGVSDVLAFKAGRGLIIEVKAPGKKHKTRASQKRFLAAAADVGATHVVADCIEDIYPFLDMEIWT